jgi:endo-1,4-beta-D-glucanase Y
MTLNASVGRYDHKGPPAIYWHVVLNRRALLGGVAASGTILTSSSTPALPVEEWRSFKSRFVSADGRVIDNGSGGVSHSEGQGWGLLFALAAQDQASFDLILTWTVRALRRPNDALHAWRFAPKDQPPVRDFNNAVDGDIFIAAALIRAGRLWGRPDHLLAAAAIGRDILRLLVRQAGPFVVLLPGIEGFETANAVTVNPSYYAFPMMSELASIVPSQQWNRLQKDGKALIERGRFGRWSLPPDWLRIGTIDAALAPAPGWPPRFSYDAVRVPLWWAWQRLPAGAAIHSVEEFWTAAPSKVVPAWVDVKTNEMAPYPATLGMTAIMRLLRLAAGNPNEPNGPTVSDAVSYYDAALILLSHIAEQEMLSY